MAKHGHPAAACRFKPIKRSLSRPSTHYYPRDGAGVDLPEYRPGDGARNQTPHRGCPVAEVVWQCRAGGAAGGRIGQPGCVDLGNAVQRAADRLPDDLPDRQACENEGDTVQPPGRMARDRIRARQGCRKAENKTEGVRLTLQPITTNPAPDYGIKGDAKITKNLKYGDHLRKRAIPTNTGKRTNPGRFIRQVGRTPHFG